MNKPPHKAPKHVPIPSKQEILDFIKSSPVRVGKRELARAFNLRGSDKIDLKAIIKELEKEGAVELFLDLHGHSILKNSFIYGPAEEYSAKFRRKKAPI